MKFGQLKDMDLREVWPYEANNFTPWLAENLSHLAEAIGIPLELEGTEIAVEGYSADILATYPADGSRVIIENQLESTDHTHLGQIMTYLAGGVGGPAQPGSAGPPHQPADRSGNRPPFADRRVACCTNPRPELDVGWAF